MLVYKFKCKKGKKLYILNIYKLYIQVDQFGFLICKNNKRRESGGFFCWLVDNVIVYV